VSARRRAAASANHSSPGCAALLPRTLTRLRSLPSWLLVALLVMSVQGVILGAYFARGKSAVDFARAAPTWVDRSHKSSIIVPSRFGFGPKTVGRGLDRLGYDGQFYLLIALDPINARYYLDAPAYRLQRPLYPAVSRLIAGGDPSLIPIVMLLVNWLAAGVGTAAVALILARHGRSPWPALLYGLAPGLTLGIHRDLTEPLAFALSVAGVWCLTRDGPHSYVPAGLLFGLAGLTRQPSLAFPAVYALARARTDRHQGDRAAWVPAATILLLGVLPYLGWALFVKVWLGSWPNTGLPSFIGPVPFAYLFDRSWALSRQPGELIGVVLPTLLWVGVVIAMRRRLTAALACALFSAIVFVIFANEFSGYPGSGRALLSVSVPILLALPEVMAAGRRVRLAYFAGFAAAMIVLPGVVLVDLLNVAGPGR
jgi:hypothetical protein